MSPARPEAGSVMVAMSGGVDSSVAAALLVEAGYDVVGVTLKLWSGRDGGPEGGCCTAADAADARSVASSLGIPYYVFDYEDEFRAAVVDPVVAGYEAGLTPNPCIECNRAIKFSLFAERARLLGCEKIATGHHARIRRDGDDFKLLKGTDAAKDQSYVLYMLDQEALSGLLLPVGEMTKEYVREVARRVGLRTADKSESQDVCFAGDDGMRGFLSRELGDRLVEGEIVDADGNVLGRHAGAALFTIGQRRGVGLSAAGQRMFVTAVDTTSGRVEVGPQEALETCALRVDDVSWVSGLPPDVGSRVDAVTRYRSTPIGASISQAGERSICLTLDSPARAVAPGQAAVLYHGESVLGGGTITADLAVSV